MTAVLGINAYHADAAACLVIDGEVVAAAEEERFTRVKHQAGLPAQASRWCLEKAGLEIADLAAIAINSDVHAHRLRKMLYILRHRPQAKLLLDRWQNRRHRVGFAQELADMLPGSGILPPVFPVEHHLAHLACAYLSSSFDDALVVSVDGFGDFAGAAWADALRQDIRIRSRVFFPHSLGIFYQALTQYLGFHDYGDEYKLMGLAAYAEPEGDPRLRQVLLPGKRGQFRLGLEFFRHPREAVPYHWSGGTPQIGTLYTPALEKLLGPARAQDEPLEDRHIALAAEVQNAYERAFFDLLGYGYEQTRSRRLALAGGCAMNSVANGRIFAKIPFDEIHIPPAPGDAGGAMGAALWVWQKITGKRRSILHRADLGQTWADDQLADEAQAWTVAQNRSDFALETYIDEADCLHQAAADLANGKVIGWFQGGMEFGPRALGFRSILADPRRADSRERINRKIKQRELFRPFAPTVTLEDAPDWFDISFPVRFMEHVVWILPHQRARIPAITHVDGSARLQTVSERDNPRLHRLLRQFGELTGVPILLNTSFNRHEPIVRSPQDALKTFLECGMDVLYLGLSRIERKTNATSTP